jgi:DNA-binding transcriptional MerR regulator
MISLELEQFIDTRSFESMGKLVDTISEEKLSAKTLGVSYRTICHWDEKGLIRFKRKTPESKRKYSFVDYIWIKVVDELRSFGIEIPIIQKIAQDIYSPIPVKDIFGFLADNKAAIETIERQIEENGVSDSGYNLESGEYKNADFTAVELQFNYLHIIVAEIIATKKPVSIIVFKNGDWFPFIKENEHLYPEDLLYKKEYESQVSVSLTNLVFNFILEENMSEFYKELNILSAFEVKILDLVAKDNYGKITVLYKSKTQPPFDIPNNSMTHEELMKVFRKKKYREFIITGKDGIEYRMRDEKQKLDLSAGVKELLKGDTDLND